MPFDMAPQETKVGKFQKFADAMLKGCAISPPCTRRYYDGGATCALGAMALGLGFDPSVIDGDVELEIERHLPPGLTSSYRRKYGNEIWRDNDAGMSREEIAARIATL